MKPLSIAGAGDGDRDNLRNKVDCNSNVITRETNIYWAARALGYTRVDIFEAVAQKAGHSRCK